MGLFGFHKKKNKVSKESKNLDIPIPNYDGSKDSDNQLKNVISADLKEKTKFDIKKVNNEMDYLDEVMGKNLDLNSKDIKKAVSSSKTQDSSEVELELPENPNDSDVHPEIKNKLEQHNETINIDLPDETKPNQNFINDPMLEKLIKKKEIKEENPTTGLISEPTESMEEIETEIEPPKKNDLKKLPDFNDGRMEINKTEKLVESFKKKRTFKENVFVKSKLYREILHSNLTIKEDIKVCDNKLNNLTKSINSQSAKGENLRQELEFIQESILTIEDKLFDSNPLTR